MSRPCRWRQREGPARTWLREATLSPGLAFCDKWGKGGSNETPMGLVPDNNRGPVFYTVCLVGVIAAGIGLWLFFKLAPGNVQMIAVLAAMGAAGYLWLRREMRRAWNPSESSVEEIEHGDTSQDMCREHGESPYVILGVDPTASGEEIRRAYRSLARQHHPDNFPAEEKVKASDRLSRINRAYQVVGDADARFDYDMFIKACWPGFPSLDEAYAFVRDRRELVKDIINAAEPYGDMPEEPERTVPPTHDGTSESACPVPVQAPETLRDSVIQPVPPALTVPQPSGAPSRAGECATCGEPYQISAGRTGPLFCERCGEELSRPER